MPNLPVKLYQLTADRKRGTYLGSLDTPFDISEKIIVAGEVVRQVLAHYVPVSFELNVLASVSSIPLCLLIALHGVLTKPHGEV